MTPRMVTIEIAGKKVDVPEGITVVKAMWYAGIDVVRGIGCLGGFCGACATYYRTKDDPRSEPAWLVRWRFKTACRLR